MAMARDGLLPSFFSDVNKHTQIPLKSTVATGICAAILAFFMEVSQLAGMVSAVLLGGMDYLLIFLQWEPTVNPNLKQKESFSAIIFLSFMCNLNIGIIFLVVNFEIEL